MPCYHDTRNIQEIDWEFDYSKPTKGCTSLSIYSVLYNSKEKSSYPQ